MKADNPFALSFGITPPEYIERYEAMDSVISTFSADNPVSRVYLIDGIRGSGKTVLMTNIIKSLYASDEWVTVDLNISGDLMEEFALRLANECRKMPNLFEKGFSLSVAGFGIGIGASDVKYNNITIIEQLVKKLHSKKKKLLITIDEVHNNKNMRYFASEFQMMLRKDYPLFLIMTGLYENIYSIQNDPLLTFLLRTPRVSMEPLSIGRIARHYENVFSIDTDAAKKLASITKGYAFAFQALGMLYFEYRNELPMEKILTKLDDMLDDYVYKKVWEGLTGKEREIIRTISTDKVSASDICRSTGISKQSFSQYRDRMMKKGIISAPERGYISITLPRFYDVIRYYE